MRLETAGDDFMVRVPRDVAAANGMHEGAEVVVSLVDSIDRGASSLEDEAATREARRAALERIAARAVPLPPGYKFDREEANAR